MARSRAKPDNRLPAQIIRDFCPLFDSFGVTSIELQYDTERRPDYGPRRDFIDMRAIQGARNEFRPRYDVANKLVDAELFGESAGDNETSIPLDGVFSRLMSSPGDSKPLVTQQDVEKIKTAFVGLLPANWTVGYGSTGTITIDVVAGAIQITHKVRRMTIEEQVIDFDEQHQPVPAAVPAAAG